MCSSRYLYVYSGASQSVAIVERYLFNFAPPLFKVILISIVCLQKHLSASEISHGMVVRGVISLLPERELLVVNSVVTR